MKHSRCGLIGNTIHFEGAQLPTITTKDGTEIFYKDWGSGQPIVFSHGWPLSADDWDAQMLFFLNHGYRVIAHDRRGHGRSSQASNGHDMDHYADDLAALTAHLDLKDAIHVGHSTGGGEVAHYLGRHGQDRVSKAALISAVPPLMMKTAANPLGLPKSVFDDLQAQLAANRSQFYLDLPSGPFYGFNRPGVKTSEAGKNCRSSTHLLARRYINLYVTSAFLNLSSFSRYIEMAKKADNKIQGSGGDQGGRSKDSSKKEQGRKSSGNKKSGT